MTNHDQMPLPRLHHPMARLTGGMRFRLLAGMRIGRHRQGTARTGATAKPAAKPDPSEAWSREHSALAAGG